MKELFFNVLYMFGLALIFTGIVAVVVFIITFVRIFMNKISGPECGHRYRQMTDKVGSPIKCLDCGKIVE